MTEEEWLQCKNPWLMLQHLSSCSRQIESWATGAIDRKLRLFGAECCRLIWHEMGEGCHRAVEAAERYAEGQAGSEALEIARMARLGDLNAFRAARLAAGWAITRDRVILDLKDSRQKALAIRETTLLREILGNPFRPVAFSPLWRTGTAVSLAQTMYESRDFGAMPILADALQDAGCDNADILDHCRNTNLTHVRGCWVVDLVRNKL